MMQKLYTFLDKLYLRLDKKLILRTKNLRLIPPFRNRQGGKVAYGEWCHVIGIFQTLLNLHLKGTEDNTILDIGCGTALLGIASEPFLGKNGKYIGIDIRTEDVAFCQHHYPPATHSFHHLDANNTAYAPQQKKERARWLIADGSVDVVTALSVWTHLNEQDASFYFKEIHRVLRPGGQALITFFYLDDFYRRSLGQRNTEALGTFHNTPKNLWFFDHQCPGSGYWYYPGWVKYPEDAMGVTSQGIDTLLTGTALEMTDIYPGNWKEIPGVFFQDVLVFRKKAPAQNEVG